VPTLAMHHDLQTQQQHGEGDIESNKAIEQHFYAKITRLLLTYSVNELFNAAVRRSHLNGRLVSFEGLRYFDARRLHSKIFR
jgi:hypothetical protein